MVGVAVRAANASYVVGARDHIRSFVASRRG